MQILLVEDKSVDRLLALEALEEIGFAGTTHSACDGEEAVSFLRQHGKYANSPRPQLVLLDLNLPGKSGHEVLTEIKTDVNLMDIPVVVFTSSVSDEDVNRAYDQRANCYVRKPSDFCGYRDVVRNIQRFWGSVALPQRPSTCPTQLPPPVATSELDLAAGATIRVLVVEDSASDVLMLETELADCAGTPFHITDVPRLADATALLATDQFDVVLTDLGLPDSSGLDSFVAINKAAGGLPVIVMTGLNDEEMGISAMRAGAQDYFVKGHLQHGLPRAIRYAIERRRTSEALRRSEERFRASLESLLDGFALLSVVPAMDGSVVDFRVDYINECGRHQQLTNASEASLTSLFPEARATGLFDELVRVAQTGKSFTRESILLSEEQARIGSPSFDFRAAKFGDGIALSWRDATERLKLEAQVLQSQKMT
ncbi:MAG: response regulator, partial [Verrucomicrobiota bacterium]|nr:response regulator [Verrucomicrobiota bacterium]